MNKDIYGRTESNADFEFELQDEVLEFLKELGSRLEDDPTHNNGSLFENEVFRLEAYNWSDGINHPNFMFEGFYVEWYKRLGRVTTQNYELGDSFIDYMRTRCFSSLEG
jgi:hypothetical protein